MNRVITVLSAAAALAVATFASSSAHAEDLTLTVGSGAAQVFHAPLAHPTEVIDQNKFQTGMSGEARLLIKIIPQLAVGPQVSVSQFSESGHHSKVADTWAFSGVAQLQGDHAAGWYPFLNASGGFAKSAQIYNPEMGASAGVMFAVENTHTYWVGVYGSFQHTFQVQTDAADQTALIDHHDSNVGTVGLMIAFDAPVKPVHTTTTVVQERVVEKTVLARATAPAPVAPTTVRVVVPSERRLDQTVQFAKDSAALDATAEATITDLATAANEDANKDVSLTVEGYASMEGDTVHNLVLSNQRAVAVVARLAAKGVARNRMTVVSVGAVGAANDASNRKVDFIVRIAAQ